MSDMYPYSGCSIRIYKDSYCFGEVVQDLKSGGWAAITTSLDFSEVYFHFDNAVDWLLNWEERE